MILKVYLLVVAYSIFVDGRRLDRFFWDGDSNIKRTYQQQQLCKDITEEEWVSTIDLIKEDQRKYPYFFPQKILKRSCKTERKPASGVNDLSIICQSKEKQIEVVEYSDQGVLYDFHNVKVLTDCVAYKI